MFLNSILQILTYIIGMLSSLVDTKNKSVPLLVLHTVTIRMIR